MPARTTTPHATPESAHATPESARFTDTELADEMFFLMARAAATGSEHANRTLGDLALKVRDYSVLALACSDEEPTQRELSEFLALDPSRIVAIVDTLEQRGTVERRTDPRDRRSKIIVATVAGRRLYADARELVVAATDRSLAGLNPDERRDLFQLMQKVAF